MKSLNLLAFEVNTAAHIELTFRNREHSAVTIPLPRVQGVSKNNTGQNASSRQQCAQHLMFSSMWEIPCYNSAWNYKIF